MNSVSFFDSNYTAPLHRTSRTKPQSCYACYVISQVHHQFKRSGVQRNVYAIWFLFQNLSYSSATLRADVWKKFLLTIFFQYATSSFRKEENSTYKKLWGLKIRNNHQLVDVRNRVLLSKTKKLSCNYLFYWYDQQLPAREDKKKERNVRRIYFKVITKTYLPTLVMIISVSCSLKLFHKSSLSRTISICPSSSSSDGGRSIGRGSGVG